MTVATTESLPGFADLLRRVPVQTLTAARVALNRAADYAREEGVDRLSKKYNLTSKYIADNLQVRTVATRASLEARIAANNRAVLATRYGARPRTVAAPGAKGNPAGGVPAGQKIAGSSAWGILRGGASKAWDNAFFIRLKGSGAFAMIARYGSGAGLTRSADWKQNLDVVNSLSVGQMWRFTRDEISPQAMALAAETFIEEMSEELAQ